MAQLLDIVNKKVNDMERMIREFKELKERMMKIMSEQFTKLVMANRKKRVFPSQPESNLRGGSSFDLNNAQKVNVVIFLWSGKTIDTHVGEKNVNKSPSPSSSSPSSQSADMNLTPIDSIPLK